MDDVLVKLEQSKFDLIENTIREQKLKLVAKEFEVLDNMKEQGRI